MLVLPIPLWAATKQHVDELLREFELMLGGRATDPDGDDTPARLLTLANTYYRRGRHLLTLASPPETVAFRQWYLREVVTQLQGGPPSPWAAARA